MAGQKYNKAYEAYQQAVYRDGRNPTFWCSIGVLYFQINQFRDALDAYSRAIRINPYISEVWFDLGSLYESCNNQITDAIDAYARASELDPTNLAIATRLQLLKNAQATGTQLPAAPGPQDVHPTAYASAVVPPPGLNGPPLMLQGNHRPPFRSDSRGPSEISLPPPSQVNQSGRPSPPAPFRGGPPPPVILDESRHMPSHTPLAPMEVDRPPHHGGRDYPPSRGEPSRGPSGHQSLLLQHPLPPQGPSDDPRNGAHPHHPDPYFRGRPPHSRSVSPAPHSGRTARSPPPFQGYQQPVGPAQPSAGPQRSPRGYRHREPPLSDQEPGWERRGPGPEWDREPERRAPRHSGEYMHPAQQAGGPFYPPRSPRAHSPPQPSPRVGHQTRYWDNKPTTSGPTSHPAFRPSPPPHQGQPPHHEQQRRYDPRHDARDNREYEPERGDVRSYPVSPEGMRSRNGPQVHLSGPSTRRSESPHGAPALVDSKAGRRRKGGDDLQMQSQQPPTPSQQHPQPIAPQFPPPPSTTPASTAISMQEPAPKKRRRANGKRKDEGSVESQRGPGGVPGGFKMQYPKGPGSPENSSHSGSSRSIQPSPTSATPRPPSRVVDEDYDEGVADALMGLANGSYRGPSGERNGEPPAHSPTVSSHSRHSIPSPRPLPSHRNSVSSSHTSPPTQMQPLKRALSPGPEETDNKRSRMEGMKQRRISSPSGGRRTPVPSTRPSPIPFRTQATTSHSPEARDQFPPSPSLPVVLPPHPRPIGAGHSNSASASIALPPIATLSPTSTAPSPTNHNDDKMHIDARSISPPSRSGKLSSRSPASKHSLSPPTEKKEPSS